MPIALNTCGRRIRGNPSCAASLYKGHGSFHKSQSCECAGNLCCACQVRASLQGIRPEDFAEPGNLFRFGREPRAFDILPEIPGVDFDTAWERRVEVVVDPATGLTANFISADDLIASKLASGRPQDIADADAIREARESQRPKKD